MATVKTTYDFDQMLSNAREAYGEELFRMAEEGTGFRVHLLGQRGPLLQRRQTAREISRALL